MSRLPIAAAAIDLVKVSDGPSADRNADMRVVTIKIGSLPSLLKPKIRVDVHATFRRLKDESADTLSTEIVVENVVVFAVDGSSVSLLVSRDNARKLIAASESGRLHVSIVHEPNETSAKDTSVTAANNGLLFKLHKKHDRLALRVMTSRIVETGQKIPRTLVDDPKIVKVIPITPNQLQLSALQQGATQLVIWDESGEPRTLDILVTADTRELELLLKHVFPNAAIEVQPLSRSVLLRGTVANPHDADRIVKIAEDYYPKVLNGLTAVAAADSKAGKSHANDVRNAAQPGYGMSSNQQSEGMKKLHQDVIELRRDVRQLINLLEKQAGAAKIKSE